MGDTLKGPVVFGITLNLSSELGIVPMSDNHGNITQGRLLTCAGNAPVTLPTQDWADMHEAVVSETATALNMSGEIDLGSKESPLQSICRKLDARAHHAPANTPKGHAK
jgi:hypothetical protein